MHGDETEDYIDNIETFEEEIPFNENDCHLCGLTLALRDKLMEHVENNHEEYFQGIMEIAAKNTT